MISKLTFEKVTSSGKKMLKFTGYENIKERRDLPGEYINSYPHYYALSNSVIIYYMMPLHTVSTFAMVINNIYTPEMIDQNIKIMKVAGELLEIINKRIEKERLEKWHGNTEIEI